MVRKKEFRLNGFISLEEINLSEQNQNYRFYLFEKSWYFPTKSPEQEGHCEADCIDSNLPDDSDDGLE